MKILKTGEKNSMWRAPGGAETPSFSFVPASSVHSSSLLSCATFWLGHRFRKIQKVARAHFTSFSSRPPMPIPRKSKTFNLAPRGVGAKFSVWHPPGSKHRAKQTPRTPQRSPSARPGIRGDSPGQVGAGICAGIAIWVHKN